MVIKILNHCEAVSLLTSKGCSAVQQNLYAQAFQLHVHNDIWYEVHVHVNQTGLSSCTCSCNIGTLYMIDWEWCAECTNVCLYCLFLICHVCCGIYHQQFQFKFVTISKEQGT